MKIFEDIVAWVGKVAFIIAFLVSFPFVILWVMWRKDLNLMGAITYVELQVARFEQKVRAERDRLREKHKEQQAEIKRLREERAKKIENLVNEELSKTGVDIRVEVKPIIKENENETD